MMRRPGLVRIVAAVVAFYGCVYGVRAQMRRADLPRREPAVAAVQAPVGPLPGEGEERDPPQPAMCGPFPAFAMLPESLWPLAPQIMRPGTREWRTIVVHHSAGTAGNAAVFDRMHREENGWVNGLGYHFVVGNGNGSPAGAVEVGGRWIQQIQGAHAGAKATEYNEHGIGICVVGNYETGDFPEEVYPGLRDLVVWLARRYDIPPERILPHREVRGEPTECPGGRFPLERLRDDVRAAAR
ncbi:MAG: N-acetylmuramoyl-L-alanine amidase [Planctomycetia bacterium]|nr:N-acetylmuramoyl-L-alanine amidase [Planctomycetia bacterium]